MSKRKPPTYHYWLFFLINITAFLCAALFAVYAPNTGAWQTAYLGMLINGYGHEILRCVWRDDDE